MASEYLQWKYRDVKPDEPVALTQKEQRQNWWYYHKWHAALCVGGVLLAVWLIARALGIGQVRPDYQAAYVGAAALGEEQAAGLETRLAALGADCDGDGRVTVQLHQYLTAQEGSEGQAMYAAAASVQLMADFESCDSYFFILEDPDAFQELYDGPLEEGWFLLEDGLYLARRRFLTSKTVRWPEECEALWQAAEAEWGAG